MILINFRPNFNWVFLLVGINCFGLVNCKSNLDCNFDHLSNSQDSGFCEWRPNFEGSKIWHTGNAVLVDSANSVVHASTDPGASANNRFAFVQGKYGSSTGGNLESPLITQGLNGQNELKLSYWKTDPQPILDICLKDSTDQSLNCIDSIIGPGQPQWVRRSIELPKADLPFRVVFRARNILSAEDIICIDDVQLISDFSANNNNNHLFEEPNKNKNNINQDESPRHQFFQSDNTQMEEKFRQSSAALLPLNKFDMQPIVRGGGRPGSTNSTAMFPASAIRPQIQMPPSPVLVYSQPAQIQQQQQEQPTLTDASLFNNDHKTYSKLQNSPPQIQYSASNYPEFISLGEGMNPTDVRRAEEQESKSCRAIKCSFMENSCLWDLGPTWKSSDGNIAKDISGEDYVTSASFKVPVAAFIQFDLWMSDTSHLMIMQGIDSTNNEDIMLFSRRGMANNGWHRFRVPLRPSFKPVSVKFRSILPENAFVTISNTRLINENDEEMNCELVENEEGIRPIQLQNIDKTPQNPIVLPTTTAPITTTTIKPFTLFPTPQIPFNPFKPMFENGLAPIVPQRDDLPRLTAFQNFNKFLMPTFPPFFPLESFHTTTSLPPNLFATLIPTSTAFEDQQQNNNNKLPVMSVDETFHPDSQQIETFHRLKDLNTEIPPQKQQPQRRRTPFSGAKQSLEGLLQSIAGQPILEQQLRFLAQRLGYDANNLPDQRALEALRGFVGTKLMSTMNLSPSSSLLPASVASSASRSSFNNNNNGTKDPLQNSFMDTSHNDIGESSNRELSRPISIPTNLKPILPINNFEHKDFEEIYKEENIRQQHPYKPPSPWLDNLASLINPRDTASSADAQLPLARENLDFVFQNALNG